MHGYCLLQMLDPLTALMYAVQVMNFLKTLVVKTLREREEYVVEAGPMLKVEPSDEDGHHSTSRSRNHLEESEEDKEEADREPLLNQIMTCDPQVESRTCDGETHGFLTSVENIQSEDKGDEDHRAAEIPESIKDDGVECANAAATNRKAQPRSRRVKSNPNDEKKASSKHAPRSVVHTDGTAEKNKDLSILSRVNSQKDRVEAWR